MKTLIHSFMPVLMDPELILAKLIAPRSSARTAAAPAGNAPANVSSAWSMVNPETSGSDRPCTRICQASGRYPVPRHVSHAA